MQTSVMRKGKWNQLNENQNLFHFMVSNARNSQKYLNDKIFHFLFSKHKNEKITFF